MVASGAYTSVRLVTNTLDQRLCQGTWKAKLAMGLVSKAVHTDCV